MTQRPAAVFFDLDGTLVDTARDFHAGINRLRARHELAPIAYAPVRAAVSDGARAVIAAGLPELASDPVQAERLREDFLADYGQRYAEHSRLFEGLEAALAWLEAHGLPWGVVTNKPSRFTGPLLSALRLDTRCAAVVCADQVSQTKPHPEPMYKAAALAGVAAERCVYVGDHARDIEAGRRAGMLTIAAGWGYVHSPEEAASWQADLLHAHPDDFTDWLRSLP